MMPYRGWKSCLSIWRSEGWYRVCGWALAMPAWPIVASGSHPVIPSRRFQVRSHSTQLRSCVSRAKPLQPGRATVLPDGSPMRMPASGRSPAGPAIRPRSRSVAG